MKKPPSGVRLKLIILAAAVVAAIIFDAFVGKLLIQHCEAYSSNSAFQILLIWALIWLVPSILVSCLIFQLRKYHYALLAQAVCLTAVTVNLVLVFSVCPMDLSHDLKNRGFEHDPPSLADTSTPAKFLIEENKKAVEEIKDRLAEEDSWFHNKFVLVGGLLAATMGYIGFAKEGQSAEERLMTLSKSPSTAIILALASVLALGIDMHVRGNACETVQIGLWIRYYVEPVLLHAKSDGNSANSLPENFYGWEEFLRAKGEPASSTQGQDYPTKRTVYWDRSAGSGKHSGELWNLFYTPHIHFLTVFVYVLYLVVFQTFAPLTERDERHTRRDMSIICFIVVQASFFAFAGIAHSAPEMFELRVLPFVPAYEAGYLAPLHYFVPCLALILLNLPYLASYWGEAPKSIAHERA